MHHSQPLAFPTLVVLICALIWALVLLFSGGGDGGRAGTYVDSPGPRAATNLEEPSYVLLGAGPDGAVEFGA